MHLLLNTKYKRARIKVNIMKKTLKPKKLYQVSRDTTIYIKKQ